MLEGDLVSAWSGGCGLLFDDSCGKGCLQECSFSGAVACNNVPSCVLHSLVVSTRV